MEEKNKKDFTLLVATSGDTGGAIASAFHKKPGMRVVVLFPEDGVTGFQKKQLTCWGENVLSLAVKGSFDDCQKLVKDIFNDGQARKKWSLTSANSINIGRLLPQSIYYAATSLWYFSSQGVAPSYIIPSGNLGNALGAFWARKMGFPIDKIVLACNANRCMSDYFESGKFNPRPSVPTLANAMDVGNPSNFERLTHLHPDLDELKKFTSVYSVSDDEIRDTIEREERLNREVWCPHTATALYVRERIDSPHWIVVATAHPAKFEETIEPILGDLIACPAELKKIRETESVFTQVPAKLGSVMDQINQFNSS